MFDFQMTKKSVHKVVQVNVNGQPYNLKYQVLWKASKLKFEDHPKLFQKNPWFIKFYVPDVKTIRFEPQTNGQIVRIEWKPKGKRCWVDLKFLKAFNLKKTVDFFEKQTYLLSDSITKDVFDSITPLGEDD